MRRKNYAKWNKRIVKERYINYIFRLKNNGQDCVKTPIGMFEEEEMENDLKKVDEIIKDYYGLKELQ